jgi:hypothetical protein
LFVRSLRRHSHLGFGREKGEVAVVIQEEGGGRGAEVGDVCVMCKGGEGSRCLLGLVVTMRRGVVWYGM